MENSNSESKVRVGLIRVSSINWNLFGDAIKRNLMDGEIVNILPAISNGQYISAVDLLVKHWEMDEVELDGGPLVRYLVEFFPNPDGTVTRGPMIRENVS